MTIVRPGTGFQIVENLQSGRKTSNMVSFFDTSRTFGDDAVAHTSRNPKKVFSFPKAYLFSPTTSVPSIGFSGYDHYFPIDAVADEERGVWKYKYLDDETFSGEELVGQLLGFYRTLGEQTNKNQSVREAVIAIPADFTQRQRQALADAANLGGLDVLAFVTETTAAAVHRAIDWRPTTDNGIDIGLFINIGSRFTESCVIETAHRVNVPRKGVNSTEVRNLGCHAEPGVGGYIGDLLIAEEMAKKFESKYKRSIKDEAQDGTRVYKKLLREAKKTKHVLSTNKQSGFYIEGLVSEIDFKEDITREQFEELLESHLTSKVLKPIEESIKGAKIPFSSITTVEVIGGGWRSPAIINKIQQFLSEQSTLAGLSAPIELGQHMNGEEAMAFGASFVAANFSSLFRIKSMQLTDTSGHDITATLTDQSNNIIASNISLVAKHAPLHKGFRHIDVPSLTSLHEANLTVTLFENGIAIQDFSILPPKDLETVKNLTLVEGVSVSYKLKTEINELGLASIVGATLVIIPASSVSSAESVANSTIAPPETKPKTYALKAESVKFYAPLPMNADQKKAAALRLSSLSRTDKEISDASIARNGLESFVYETKNKIEGWEAYEKVTTENERESIISGLDAAEAWLYDEGFSLSAVDFLSAVGSQSTPIKTQVITAFERAKEFDLRPKAEELMKKLRNKVEQQVKNNLPSWITQEPKTAILSLVTEVEEWFLTQQGIQASLPLTDAPAYVYKDVTTRVQKIVKRIDTLKQTPKPKETTTTTTTIAAGEESNTQSKSEDVKETETSEQIETSTNEPADVPLQNDEL